MSATNRREREARMVNSEEERIGAACVDDQMGVRAT